MLLSAFMIHLIQSSIQSMNWEKEWPFNIHWHQYSVIIVYYSCRCISCHCTTHAANCWATRRIALINRNLVIRPQPFSRWINLDRCHVCFVARLGNMKLKSGGYLLVPTNIHQNKIAVFLGRWSSRCWNHHFGYRNVSKTVGGSTGSPIWPPSN